MSKELNNAIVNKLSESGLVDDETLAETGDPAYFLLNTPKEEVLLGLTTIIECLIFAEEKGLLPSHDYEWWATVSGLYQCGRPIHPKD